MLTTNPQPETVEFQDRAACIALRTPIPWCLLLGPTRQGKKGGTTNLSPERLCGVCGPASGAVPPLLELPSSDAFLLSRRYLLAADHEHFSPEAGLSPSRGVPRAQGSVFECVEWVRMEAIAAGM